jgi:hypothetical protein
MFEKHASDCHTRVLRSHAANVKRVGHSPNGRQMGNSPNPPTSPESNLILSILDWVND